MTDPNEWLMGGVETPERRKSPEMDGKAAEIAGRLREMFYTYTSRTDRTTQSHLGPSEIGTPCDRRIAMSLMQAPRINPGGDNWASFKGTCVHEGLAKMFDWANANTGRYATEVPVHFESSHVPRGTLDLIDRTLVMVADHKLLGNSSLSKLRFEGPSPRYRVQLHTYALGAVRAGESVEDVALVAWPAESQSLKGLHVWTEPYDEQIARDALGRVDRIAEDVNTITRDGYHPMMLSLWATADDCRFCPFHTKTNLGCHGHQS
ncbi:hypothetical protein [Streptomyces sp. NPDC048611]|uniref:hypothetical protein n=1 Tax=Streptomyces sp. NPDC048611 TaxID=3155635 RepID=UPI003429EB4E